MAAATEESLREYNYAGGGVVSSSTQAESDGQDQQPVLSDHEMAMKLQADEDSIQLARLLQQEEETAMRRQRQQQQANNRRPASTPSSSNDNKGSSCVIS
eukprot:4735677-Ditylum_brightwellii.AAC.1